MFNCNINVLMYFIKMRMINLNKIKRIYFECIVEGVVAIKIKK